MDTEVDDKFIDIIDDLVIMAEPGSELEEGLKWIDKQAAKRNITFYEMALAVLRKHTAEKKAKEWYREKFKT